RRPIAAAYARACGRKRTDAASGFPPMRFRTNHARVRVMRAVVYSMLALVAAVTLSLSAAAALEPSAKLAVSGEIGEGEAGWSVALSGDGQTAIVGAPYDNGGIGAAWVFTRSGAGWAQQGPKLTGPAEVGAG